MCRATFLGRFASRWTLLPLRLVMGAGFVAHGVAKLTRGPAKFGLLLQQAGVPFPLHTAWMVGQHHRADAIGTPLWAARI
jgi:uncharacterized membrane protein YphA (DoxX/SURF4 family)